MTEKKHIVVLGGGTGTHTVLSGLKKYTPECAISAIVAMSDSGGSTGRLRDEFGHLPVGDVRMALAALADEHGEERDILRKLFLYRFDRGGAALEGHNFGNLFLTALTELLGSEEEAIEVAGTILRICGSVIPVSTEHLTLCARYSDGVTVTGEALIDAPDRARGAHRIEEVWVTPESHITDRAAQVISSADLIVLGPGDLYTSLLAVCVVGGVSEALSRAPAPFVHVSNLMTRYGQTSGFGVAAHVREIARYAGRTPDIVVINDAPLPTDLLARYEAEGEYQIVDDGNECEGVRVIRSALLANEEFKTERGDKVRRSFIRHDPHRLAEVLHGLLSA